MVQSGKLRHRIALQRRTKTDDDWGKHSGTTWQTILQTQASVKNNTGEFTEHGPKMAAESSHIFMIRYPDPTVITISVNDRIQFRSKNYYIGFIQNVDERDRVLNIFCTEGSD